MGLSECVSRNTTGVSVRPSSSAIDNRPLPSRGFFVHSRSIPSEKTWRGVRACFEVHDPYPPPPWRLCVSCRSGRRRQRSIHRAPPSVYERHHVVQRVAIPAAPMTAPPVSIEDGKAEGPVPAVSVRPSSGVPPRCTFRAFRPRCIQLVVSVTDAQDRTHCGGYRSHGRLLGLALTG